MSVSPIAAMFDRISPKYDTLNHLLSLNIDKAWRRKTAIAVAKCQPKTILDLATGTADLAIVMAKYNPQAHIVGVDISDRMLEIGKTKITGQQLERQIELRHGDAVALPFPDGSFDTVTAAFGVRNFEDLNQGIAEISRVCRSGGCLCILELTMPEKFPLRQLYRIYFKHLLPSIGKIVSKDRSAYAYLPTSVERFPKPAAFAGLLASHDLYNIAAKRLTCGIATLFTATKL